MKFICRCVYVGGLFPSLLKFVKEALIKSTFPLPLLLPHGAGTSVINLNRVNTAVGEKQIMID